MPPFLNPDQSAHLIENIFKDFFIIGAIIYIIFAVVVVRQIAVMKKTLITPVSSFISLLGYIHLALSVLVLFFYLSLL